MNDSSRRAQIANALETAMLTFAVLATSLVGVLNLTLAVMQPYLYQTRTASHESNRRVIALGDVDGDGDLDALVSHRRVIRIWLNDGQATFQESGQLLGDSGGDGVVLGDVDRDGDVDAIVGTRVWVNDGKGRFSDIDHRFEE